MKRVLALFIIGLLGGSYIGAITYLFGLMVPVIIAAVMALTWAITVLTGDA